MQGFALDKAKKLHFDLQSSLLKGHCLWFCVGLGLAKESVGMRGKMRIGGFGVICVIAVLAPLVVSTDGKFAFSREKNMERKRGERERRGGGGRSGKES